MRPTVMHLEDTLSSIIRIPRANEALEPLTIDMEAVRQAEHRLDEVAIVNAQRAPELMMTFNRAYLDTSKHLALLEYEVSQAKRKMGEVKAVMLLDRLPDLLKAKGLATPRSPLGSEDIRQAFLDQDPDYQRAAALVNNIQCYISLMEGQRKAFENGYTAVKKIFGSDNTYQRQNPNLVVPATDNPSPHNDYFGVPR